MMIDMGRPLIEASYRRCLAELHRLAASRLVNQTLNLSRASSEQRRRSGAYRPEALMDPTMEGQRRKCSLGILGCGENPTQGS